MKTVSHRRCSVALTVNEAVTSEVGSVRKALDLLSCFSFEEPEWSLSNLARRCEIPKSTAHNLLKTLQSFDLVRQDLSIRTYRLGPRTMELGLLFARSAEIMAHARPAIRRLAEEANETVKLGILSVSQVLIVAAFESTHSLHTRADVGRRWPLHSSSLGKAILSVLPSEEARDILHRMGMPRYTASTITAWPEMEQEIQRIRAKGYALDIEESEPGVRCVAVPLASDVTGEVAAISISAPSVRMDDCRLAGLTKEALAAARRIAAQSPGLIAGTNAVPVLSGRKK